MPAKRWTTKEDRYLRQFFPRRGKAYVAKKLGRSINSVKMRAYRLGLLEGVPNGFVPLAWVDPRNDLPGASGRALKAAREANVLKRYRRKYIVPEAWADAYANKIGQQRELERKTRTWATTRELAEAAGYTHNVLLNQLAYGYSLGKHLKTVERVKVNTPVPHWRWHAQQAHAAIRAWRANQ